MRSTFSWQFGVQVTYGIENGPEPVSVETFQAVRKPNYSIRFGSILPEHSTKLAYAASDDIDGDLNISLTDFSQTVAANSREFTLGEDIFVGNSYNSSYRKFLLTDIFSTASPTQPSVPLYYVHRLPSSVNPAKVTILDSNFEPVGRFTYTAERVYIYDNATGEPTSTVDYIAVYNNLVNSYNEDTGELEVYYVRYLGSSGQVTVILNNEQVFREARAGDIWINAKLKPWVKAYLIEELASYYKLTLPDASGEYGIKTVEQARMYVRKPAVTDKESPWFVKVANGSLKNVLENGTFSYAVAEFRNQLFNPIEPYKLAAGIEVVRAGQGLVALKHQPSALGYLPMDLEVYGKGNVPLYALTTDASKDGRQYRDTSLTWDSSKILSFDDMNGLVYVDLDIKDYHTLYATYYYREEFYEYTQLDFNPIFNNSVIDGGFFAIYVVPNITDSDSISVRHIHVDKSGVITESPEDDSLIDIPYGKRSSPTTGTFLADYSSLGDNDYQYFILAEVSVVEHTSIEDTVLMDVRTNGGGIKEARIDEAIARVPEVIWYADISNLDGLPFPGQSSVIVNLPYTLLAEYGGVLTREDVREIVKKHMALGSYPIIRYYGPKPNLYLDSDSFAIDGAVKLYWNTENPEARYNIYYGLEQDGSFTKHNATPITDNSPYSNQYYLDGLLGNVPYWVYVVAVDSDGNETLKSRKLRVLMYNDGMTYEMIGHKFTVL